jgi:hypothetical protein
MIGWKSPCSHSHVPPGNKRSSHIANGTALVCNNKREEAQLANLVPCIILEASTEQVPSGLFLGLLEVYALTWTECEAYFIWSHSLRAAMMEFLLINGSSQLVRPI